MIRDVPALIDDLDCQIRKQTDVAVLGMSGGADSTLVALLCRQALGPGNVYDVHMPYGPTDKEKYNARSVRTAARLNFQNSVTIPIYGIADAIVTAVESKWGRLTDVNAGNARSRARMTVLYAVAHRLGSDGLKARVVGTGNLGEDFIGYDTKGGDALCDFFPIGELLKSEVYQLLEYFRDRGDIDEDMIDRVPSAGLWDGHSDEVELGYTYNAMEPSVLKFLPFVDDENAYALMAVLIDSPVDQFVFDRYWANKHKHEGPLVCTLLAGQRE